MKPEQMKPEQMKPEDMTPVPSPCISLCKIGANGLCEGCLRTLAEIRIWREASDEEKRAVWREIRRREEQLGFD